MTKEIDDVLPDFLKRAKPPTDAVLLSTVATDLGLVPAVAAQKQAQKAANETGEKVTIRHPVTDKVLATTKPTAATPKSLDIGDPRIAEHPIAKANAASWPTGKKVGAKEQQLRDMRAADDKEKAKVRIAKLKAGQERKKRVASGEAAAMPLSGKAALAKIDEPTTSTPKETTVRKTARTSTKARAAKPSKSKARTAVAKTTATKPAAKKGKTEAKGPKGMVVEILKLASRANGVTPAELNTLTSWKGAPWKWLFSNPKGNGYCDRWDYKFQVTQGKDGETRYKATKKAAA